jgi:uncharacterized protein YbjT (DUF2867 family)
MRSNPKESSMILITTAGKVGSEAAALLGQSATPARILVRDHGRATALASLGIEVVTGDLDDASTLMDAMNRVTAVILVSPAVPAQELRVIAAAAQAGVQHIVKVTSKASPDSPIARRRGQSEIEAGLAASGVDHTLLRANAYMQNFLALAPMIAATDGFASSAANGRVGLVDARDVAAVAAQIATHPDEQAVNTYWITGPELLSYRDVADILSRTLHRTITFRARTAEEDQAAMTAAGIPAPIAEQNAQAFSLIATGDAEWLSDDTTKILGHPGRSFQQFADDHATAFTASPQPTRT